MGAIGGVEHAQLYGVPGQAQDGIDIYARRAGGVYVVYQCRRVESFTATRIADVVTDFLEGAWRDEATELVLCTSADLSRTELAEAVEAGNERLRPLWKSFLSWDVARLSEELKELPRLVLDFFGRSWVEAFVPGALEELTDRLDARQLRELRGALREFYSNVFALQDTAALLGLSGVDAWQRFVIPDVAELWEVVDAMAREKIAVASVLAFTVSETIEAIVFTPIRRRNLTLGVALSATVGNSVDSSAPTDPPPPNSLRKSLNRHVHQEEQHRRIVRTVQHRRESGFPRPCAVRCDGLRTDERARNHAAVSACRVTPMPIAAVRHLEGRLHGPDFAASSA